MFEQFSPLIYFDHSHYLSIFYDHSITEKAITFLSNLYSILIYALIFAFFVLLVISLGMAENEIVMRKYTDLYMADMQGEELANFSEFLDELDPDMYKWISGQLAFPDKYNLIRYITYTKSIYDKLDLRTISKLEIISK